MNSDIDSGDENVADGDVSVLSGNQLQRCAGLEMKLTIGKVARSNNNEQNKTNGNQDLPSEPKKKKNKSKVKDVNKWKHFELSVINDFEWNFPISTLDLNEPLLSLFKTFLTDDILQLVMNCYE